MFRNYVIANGNLSREAGRRTGGVERRGYTRELAREGERTSHRAREEQAKGSISGAGQHELESPLRTARRNPDKQVRFLLSEENFSLLLVVNLLICDALNDAVSNPDYTVSDGTMMKLERI